jgi:hypothetical protein
VQVVNWVFELLTKGKVELATSKQARVARDVRYITECLGVLNPRVGQLLIDSLINETMTLSANELTPKEEKLVDVVGLAEELGYKEQITHKNRGLLGKYVKGHISQNPMQERRLCNGTVRPINLYRHTDELEEVIHQYFAK